MHANYYFIIYASCTNTNASQVCFFMLLTSQLLTSQEHPDFMIPIFEKHSQLWAKDMEDIQAMCTQKHGTRISEFARDVVAAWKVHPAPTNSFALPPRAADVSNIHEA
jgi:hypothetical protein